MRQTVARHGALRGRLAALVDVMSHRDLRRLQLGWTAFYLVDIVSMVALSVWAFDYDGASAVGLLGFARLLPGAIALPFGAWAADRFSRRRVVTFVFAAMAVTQGAIAVALLVDASAAVVYLLVAINSVAGTPYRSAHLALVPLIARTPAELVATNVAAGLLEGVATFVGPAIVALLLLGTDPWFVVLAAALAAAGGGLALSTIHIGVDPSKAVRRTRNRPLEELIGGLTELRRNTHAAVVVWCFIVQLTVRGVLTVLLVSVSFELLALGSSGVGWLAAAMGVGGILGGFYGVSLTGRRRLGRPFAIALTMWGLPIAFMGLFPDTAVVVLALLTIGVGNALLDVSGLTLIQRLSPDRSLGRVFGVLFTLGIAMGGLGSVAAPALVSALGLRTVLVVVGAVLPLLALLMLGRFRTIDQQSEPVALFVELFSQIPLFAPLPATTVEKIAASSSTVTVPAGAVIVTEGDVGDTFYAIVAGEVEVRRGTVYQCTLGPGDHFGEIALVRDINRTATVVALSDVQLATLASNEFLDALASSEAAHGVAWRTTGDRIDEHAAVGHH